MNTSIPVIIADLESKYQHIKKEKDDEVFYLKLANYGKYLLDNESILAPLLLPLYKESRADIIPYKKAGRAFIKKWKSLARDLLKKIEARMEKDKSLKTVSGQVHELKVQLERDGLSYFWDHLHLLYRAYSDLAEELRKLKKTAVFLSEHLDDQGSLLIDPIYLKALEEWNRFKKLREIKPWWAHYNLMRLTYGVLNLEDKGQQYFENDNKIDQLYRYEFREIGQGRTGNLILLKRSKFEEWIDIFHGYLIPRLKNTTEMKIKEPITRGTSLKKFILNASYLPSNWQLEENQEKDKAFIKKNEKTVFVFPHIWSSKYKYFKCLWQNHGRKVSCKEIYEFESNLEYPGTLKPWQTNRNIRNTINKLKKEFKNKRLDEIEIKTHKGFTLLIRNS